MATDNDKQILLLVGNNSAGDLILQLFDIDNDEWYPEKIISKTQIQGKFGYAFCAIGSKVYLVDEVEEENEEKQDGEKITDDDKTRRNDDDVEENDDKKEKTREDDEKKRDTEEGNGEEVKKTEIDEKNIDENRIEDDDKKQLVEQNQNGDEGKSSESKNSRDEKTRDDDDDDEELSPFTSLSLKKKTKICSFDLNTNEFIHLDIVLPGFEGIKEFIPLDRRVYFVEPVTGWQLFYFDIDTNTWDECPEAQLHISDFTRIVTMCSGIAYVWNPFNSEGVSYDVESKESKDVASIHPWPKRGRFVWNVGAGGPISVIATELNGKVYAVAINTLSKIFTYIPQDDQWQIIEPKNSPFVILVGSLTTCNGRLIAVSRFSILTMRYAIKYFDFEKNKWKYKSGFNRKMTNCLEAFPVYKSALNT